MDIDPARAIPGAHMTDHFIGAQAGRSQALAEALLPLFLPGPSPRVVLCIGSMLVPGDSLGPRVGSLLEAENSSRLRVFGTQASPVHALNLEQTLLHIREAFPGSPILAVDAALAPLRYLGRIFVGAGPLSPGEGLSKSLLPAGDAHIAAITGVSGPLGYPMLKLCPALQIQRMASIIAEGILLAASQAPAPPLPAARQMTACAGAAAAFCAYPTPIKNGTEG